MVALPDPYYDDGQVTLYQGDALKLAELLEEQATVVVTDPPYGIDYRPAGFHRIAGDQSRARQVVHPLVAPEAAGDVRR